MKLTKKLVEKFKKLSYADTESGKCPNCGSFKLEYFETHLFDTSRSYDAKCLDCGLLYEEWEEYVFSGIVIPLEVNDNSYTGHGTIEIINTDF